jgi:hypothetical protein
MDDLAQKFEKLIGCEIIGIKGIDFGYADIVLDNGKCIHFPEGYGIILTDRKANYTEKVKFSSTNNYGCGPKNEDDVYTVKEFLRNVEGRMFVDYDGFGYPVKDKLADNKFRISPSKCPDCIPIDATHIVWYNR